jgi:hypothetical protein
MLGFMDGILSSCDPLVVSERKCCFKLQSRKQGFTKLGFDSA